MFLSKRLIKTYITEINMTHTMGFKGWYPQYQEQKDDEYLNFFNNHERFFKQIPKNRETEQYSTIDRRLIDRKNRTVNVEIKTRLMHINSHDTIFIEDKKWDALKKDYEEKGIIPLYINFFYDYRSVWIIDLRQYFDNRQTQPDARYFTIDNKGYDRIDENQLRYLLPQRHGIYYEFDQEQKKYIRKW